MCVQIRLSVYLSVCLIDHFGHSLCVVPVRTVGEAAYRLRFFRARFIEAREMVQVGASAAERHLLALLQDERWRDELAKYRNDSPSAAELIAAASKGQKSTPWARPYLTELLRLLRFSDHEAVDHPVASVCVICSDSESPVGEAAACVKRQVPPLMAKGLMESNILRQYVLLHDLTSPNCPTEDRLAGIVGEMQIAFGAGAVAVLRIGADGILDAPVAAPDFWTADREPLPFLELLDIEVPGGSGGADAPAAVVPGCGFSESDSDEMNKFVARFVVKTLLPHLEQRVRTLHHQVSSTRKGLRNQLKSFWTGRRHDQDTANGRNGNAYAAASPEAQLRVLGDLAMMLGDYDLALSHFKLLIGDYKQDRAWKHMAGVQDAIGLCHLALAEISSGGKRDSDREAELSFEFAAENYVAAENSPGASRYASRSMVLLAEGFRVRSLHEASTTAYLNAALAERKHTNAVRAAVLLEQAAWSHLRCQPPLVRKSSFHMVLAAHRYNVGSLRLHSRHAYASVAGLYDHGWNHIEEHITFCLARLCGHLGEPTAAISHFLQLLSGPSVGPQTTYLNEFLLMVRQAASLHGGDVASSSIGDGTEAHPLRLRLPDITPQPKMINFADTVTYATPDSAGIGNDRWRALEASLVTEDAAVRTPTWLDLAMGRSDSTMASNMKSDMSCVVNEEIAVDVELRNILGLPFRISRLRLVCSYSSTSSGTEAVVEEGEDGKLVDTAASADSHPLSSDHDVFEEALALEPKEVVVTKLRVVPRREGRMRILGVAWLLEGVAHGRCDLHGLVQASKSRRRDGMASHNQRRDMEETTRPEIAFKVLPPMPLLSASIEGVPTSIHSGGICEVRLVLKNVSDVRMHKIRICFDSPSLMLQSRHAVRTDTSDEVFDVADGGTLGRGEELVLPLWIHAPSGMDGLQRYLAAIAYEPQDATTDALKHRILRLSGSYYVTPSLLASASLVHGLAGGYPGRTRMKVSIRNMSGSQSFMLRQIRCESAAWRLEPLPGALSEPGMIRAGESWNLLFHLAIRENRDNALHVSSLAIPETNAVEEDELPFPVKMYHSRAQPAWSMPADDPSATPERCSVLIFWEQCDIGSDDHTASSRKSLTVLPSIRLLGAHHLFNLSISSGPPLRAWMTGPSEIVHDFAAGPCRVPVSLHIHNRASGTLTVLVEAGDGALGTSPSSTGSEKGGGRGRESMTSAAGWESQQRSGGSGALGTARRFMWQGGTRRKVQGLVPGEDRTISMEAAVFAPGILGLGGYRLLWAVEMDSVGTAGSIDGEAFIVKIVDGSGCAPQIEMLG